MQRDSGGNVDLCGTEKSVGRWFNEKQIDNSDEIWKLQSDICHRETCGTVCEHTLEKFAPKSTLHKQQEEQQQQ